MHPVNLVSLGPLYLI